MISRKCEQCKHFIIAKIGEGKIYGCDRSKCVFEPTTKNNLGVDCISRKAVLDITWQDPSYTDPLNVLTEVRNKVRELPSVTPQEPRTGHWIMTSDYLTTAYGSIDYVKCSCCGEDSLEEGDYCPNCGAKMVDPQESEE